MEIETLKKDNRKKWIIGSIVVILLAVAIFFVSSKANYRLTEKVNIANGIINWSPSDLDIMAIKLQNSSGGYDNTNSVPASGYTLSNTSYCEVDGVKDTSIPMEYSNGKVTIGVNKKNTKCYLYFDKQRIANEYLIEKGEMINENGYRYEGKSPNNYVTFNNETWRIIGVFNVENTDTGKTENLVKLIRNESIGDIIWDTYAYFGTNDWTASDLKTVLNGQYYNGEDINYTYRNSNKSDISSNPTVSITGKSINDAARTMIQNVKWHLGGISTYSEEPVSPSDPSTPSEAEEATASKSYTAERGTTVASGNKTTWNGNVGLMYPSDYGYAVDATSCDRTTALRNYSGTCFSNNWLFNSDSEWTIIPASSDSYGVFVLHSSGSIRDYNATDRGSVRPSIYLKSNVVITGGDGTSTNPYTVA